MIGSRNYFGIDWPTKILRTQRMFSNPLLEMNYSIHDKLSYLSTSQHISIGLKRAMEHAYPSSLSQIHYSKGLINSLQLVTNKMLPLYGLNKTLTDHLATQVKGVMGNLNIHPIDLLNNLSQKLSSSGNALSISEQQPNIIEDLIGNLENIWYEFEEEETEPINLQSDGSISLGKKVITQPQLEEVIRRILTGVSTYGLKFYNLLTVFIKHPVMLVVLGAVLAPYFSDAYKQSKKNKTNYFKQILSNIVADEQADIPPVFKIKVVTIDNLPVRRKPNGKSRIDGYLQCFDIVEVLPKKEAKMKGWRKVRLKDQAGEIILQGWVKGKYLKGN
jgi:hypothetical protein